MSDKYQWHAWFAWFPVEIADGHWRWLERVERKLCDHYNFYIGGTYWKYRLPASEPDVP